ncbi:MAG: DUF924 family protein, partial [Persicimonas sp.]
MVQSQDVLDFWFGSDDEPPEAERQKRWFIKDADFDERIRTNFGQALEQAIRGEYDQWAQTPRGRLALVILLDQFSRNIFRASPRAWSQDLLAQKLTLDGLEAGVDEELSPIERGFFYLPLEHAEDLHLQELSVEKFREIAKQNPTDEFVAGMLDYALRHHEIIERFGRFPHRNEVISRPTTTEEATFLEQPNS